MATRERDGGGESERRTDGLPRARRAAGLSRVRRAAPNRSHEGHSFGGSGEERRGGDYSQPVHRVKQPENVGKDCNRSYIVSAWTLPEMFHTS